LIGICSELCYFGFLAVFRVPEGYGRSAIER